MTLAVSAFNAALFRPGRFLKPRRTLRVTADHGTEGHGCYEGRGRSGGYYSHHYQNQTS